MSGNRLLHRCLLALACATMLVRACLARAEAVSAPKTNPMPVYMHYMPWFETPETLAPGQWGYHWRMANRNPNIVDASGRRQIASHYYPKIGPYASRDRDVIEYHLLLMKYSGVDGLLIDWYGVQGSNGDVASLLANSNAVVDQVGEFGLKFGVVLEDRFSANIAQAQANVAYLRDNYFDRQQYIRAESSNNPLLMVFGPITFQQPVQWTQILAEAGEEVDLLTLWYESTDAGGNADGEFAWIYEDAGRDDFESHVRNFYARRAAGLGLAAGVAFPGFNDYYQEGGVGQVVPFDIPHNNGQTLAATLALAQQYKSQIDMLQLATWNDFGEGTAFEPTVETGFSYLVQLQQFTGVAYGESELELVYRLYRARKEFASDAEKQARLDEASQALAALNVAAARAIVDSLTLAGDFDENGTVDGADLLDWQRQLSLTGLFPLARRAADANADGTVDQKDLTSWLSEFGRSAADVNLRSVPEPACCQLVLPVAILAAACNRYHARAGRSSPHCSAWPYHGATTGRRP